MNKRKYQLSKAVAMKFRVNQELDAIANSLKATNLKLFWVQLFGKTILDNDSWGNRVKYSQYKGKFYFLSYERSSTGDKNVS